MDHYRVLQVSRDAEPEVIEKAYKALSLKYHPDVSPTAERSNATKRMQRLNEAYRVLSDARARERYDRTLAVEDRGGGSGWDRFWDAGLAGLFVDWLEARS